MRVNLMSAKRESDPLYGLKSNDIVIWFGTGSGFSEPVLSTLPEGPEWVTNFLDI